MQYLKADTITEVTIGPAVAVGDGFTPVTGLVGSSADEFEIIKHGATSTTTIAGTLAAITGADGYYALDLSATDTNTEGRLTLLINDDTLILPIRHEFMVVNANVFDSLFAVAGTDLLQTDQTEIVGTTVPTPTTAGVPDVNVERWLDTLVTLSGALPDVNVEAMDANSIAAGTIAAGELTNIEDEIWDALKSAHVVANSFGDFLDIEVSGRLAAADINLTAGVLDEVAALTNHTAQTGDSFARIGAAGASLTDLGGMSTAMKAEILVEINAALDTAICELSQGIPTATPTIRTGLMLMYMALRNKLDVATSGTDTLEVHSDDGTRIAQKLLTDAGGDYSEAKMSSGA